MQRGEIFEIIEVSAGITPELYTLKTLYGDILPENVYGKQLKKAPNPSDAKFQFEIEEILDERGSGKNKEYFVKYLFYPNKMNKWISAQNIVKSKK